MKNTSSDLNGKMPQKKREVQYTEKPLVEVQADHELFLQAFEKPTQIYRYLRTRNILSPIFLHRSLYYMKNRMSRNHKNRSSFKIDNLIDKVEKNELQSSHPGSFLNLSFIGFFDKRVEGEGDLARLEVHVVKMCHKKRKEASAPLTQACVGTHDVLINPPTSSALNQLPSHQDNNHLHNGGTDGAGAREPVVTIPTHTFGGSNGHQLKSFLLQFKVELVHDQENVCEPASKRRRLSRGGSCVATAGGDSNDSNTTHNNNNNVANGPAAPADGGNVEGGGGSVSCYRAELVVYDRHGRCQLTPGTYDLLLQPMNGSGPAVSMGRIVGNSPRKSASWETAEDLKVEAANFNNFQNSNPTLQFRLTWTHESGGAAASASSGVSSAVSVNSSGRAPNGGSLLRPVIRPKQPLSVILANDNATKPKPQGVCSPEAPQLVLYQFVYNNNGRQQTEARRDFHCPWCSINCLALYCLLKHLKLCHARFTFTYVPHPKGARIDVALNDCYDGSYAGNPQDLVWLSGGSGGALFSRAGPARRAPTTSLLVCRPRRSKPSLSEFLEQDHADFDLPRSYILGHNRLYHHTMSCRPIGAHELDEDSEGEHDSRWMRSKTVTMIDDFSDVNEGEKEIMKLWNVHVMKYKGDSFVGDCQLAKSCALFVEAHGEELLRRNLYRNYVLHLVSLYEFGVMGAGAIYNNIRQLQDLMKDKPELKETMSFHWSKQRDVAPRAFTSPRSSSKTLSTSKASSAGAAGTPSVAKALFTNASTSSGGSSSVATPTGRTASAAAGRSSVLAGASANRSSSASSNASAKSSATTPSNSSKSVSSAAPGSASHKMSTSCNSGNSSSNGGVSASNSRGQTSVSSTPTSKSTTASSSANNSSIKTPNSTNATNVSRGNTPRSSNSSSSNHHSSTMPRVSISQLSPGSVSHHAVNGTSASKCVSSPNITPKTGNPSKASSTSSKSSNSVPKTQNVTPKSHQSNKSSTTTPSSATPKSNSAVGKANSHSGSHSSNGASHSKTTHASSASSTPSGSKHSQNSNSNSTVKSNGGSSSSTSNSSNAKNSSSTPKTSSAVASSNANSSSTKNSSAVSSPAHRKDSSNSSGSTANSSDAGGSKQSASKAKSISGRSSSSRSSL